LVAQSKVADRIERATRAATGWGRPSSLVDNSHVVGFGASDRRSESFDIVLSQLALFPLSPRVMVIHWHDRDPDPVPTPWVAIGDRPTRAWDVVHSRLALADLTLGVFHRKASGLHNVCQQCGLFDPEPADLEAEYLTYVISETCPADMVATLLRAPAAGSSPVHHDAHSHWPRRRSSVAG
jgi:hypothetical protein